MPAAETPQITKTSFPRKVRRVLGLDLHSWEQWMLLSLGLAALAAVAVVVTTASVVILQRNETTQAKQELEAYKLEAGERISEANERAANASRIAESERLERIKIEQRLAPRSLAHDTIVSIVEGVRMFAPQKFRFISYQEDQEVKGLVLQLARVLVGAGWQGLPPTEALGFGLVLGVVIEYAPSKAAEFEPAAKALAGALNSGGILASTAANAEVKETDIIRIKVGKKPQQ